MLKRMERESNYELLRIVSMFFIVLWHVIQHSYLLENTTGVTNLVFNAIKLFIIVHVNSFLLITGYYQSKSKFKLRKLVSLIFQIWFYNILINSIFKFTGLVEYTNIDYLVRTSFFSISEYWYIKCYIIVYLLSPFFNLLIEKMDRKFYKRLLIVLLLSFSIFPFLTANLFYAEGGTTLTFQVCLYFFGAYIRKYNLQENLFTNINLSQKRLLYFVSFFVFWIINVFMNISSTYLNGLESNILSYIGSCLGSYKLNYNNPITLFQSLSIFLFFGTFSFKSKFINKISSLTLGVYLIHEMKYVQDNIYKWIGIYADTTVYGKAIILKAICWALIIFIICLIIEYLRQLIVKLLFKIKTVDKKYNDFINYLHRIFEIRA